MVLGIGFSVLTMALPVFQAPRPQRGASPPRMARHLRFWAILLIAGVVLFAVGTVILLTNTERLVSVVRTDSTAPTEAQNFYYLRFEDVDVYLDTADGLRLVSFSIALEVSDLESVRSLQSVSPKILDQLQFFLRGLRVEEFQGAAGIYRVREELLYRFNKISSPVRINGVYFENLIIQ